MCLHCLYFALFVYICNKNSSSLFVLLPNYLFTQCTQKFRRLSQSCTFFSVPCWHQPVPRVIIHRVSTVSIARSSLNLWPPIFCCSSGNMISVWRLFVLIYSKPYLLIYFLIPWTLALREKQTGFQLVKKFPAFYGIWMFITAFTRALHLFLSSANSIQSTAPHPTSWRSMLILSSHLRLGVPNGLFPSGFPTKTLYMLLLAPYVLHALPISFFSTSSPEQYWVRSTDHQAPHYVVFSIPMVLRSS